MKQSAKGGFHQFFTFMMMSAYKANNLVKKFASLNQDVHKIIHR